jgi:HK97 gp10 family phage protein
MTDSWRKVKEALDKLPTAVQEKVVAKATRAGAKIVAEEAKRIVHVQTGTLKLSIGVAKAKKKDTPEFTVKYYVVPKTKIKKKIKATVDGKESKIAVGSTAYYGAFVEFGTSKMSARPFLRPAIENTKTEVLDEFQRVAMKNIDREIEKLKK